MPTGKLKRTLVVALWLLILAGFVAFAMYQGMSAETSVFGVPPAVVA